MRCGWMIACAAATVLACAQQTQEDAPAASEAATAEEGSAAWKIENAMSAAPPEIAEDAAVMDWPSAEGAEMLELRAGTNGWTCMPDVPATPGADPMCLDEVFLSWAAAWQSRATPDVDRVGTGYMLRGGYDASNTDPFATEPGPGNEWIQTGPHVMMVVPDVAALEGMTDDPANGGPWVMWRGTPYAHIMMPVPGDGGSQ
ncbi:MAG: hypothetical protein ACRELD_15015 [Longimicrobiales bacterium]